MCKLKIHVIQYPSLKETTVIPIMTNMAIDPCNFSIGSYLMQSYFNVFSFTAQKYFSFVHCKKYLFLVPVYKILVNFYAWIFQNQESYMVIAFSR